MRYRDRNGVVHLRQKDTHGGFRTTVCEDPDGSGNFVMLYSPSDLTPCDEMLTCIACLGHEKRA